MKNPCNKERRVYKGEQPYAKWIDPRTGWQYELLKSWQSDNDKPYARWFMRVNDDMGDTYVSELHSTMRHANYTGQLEFDTTVWPDLESFMTWSRPR
jgi:hypothetical protein